MTQRTRGLRYYRKHISTFGLLMGLECMRDAVLTLFRIIKHAEPCISFHPAGSCGIAVGVNTYAIRTFNVFHFKWYHELHWPPNAAKLDSICTTTKCGKIQRDKYLCKTLIFTCLHPLPLLHFPFAPPPRA